MLVLHPGFSPGPCLVLRGPCCPFPLFHSYPTRHLFSWVLTLCNRIEHHLISEDVQTSPNQNFPKTNSLSTPQECSSPGTLILIIHTRTINFFSSPSLLCLVILSFTSLLVPSVPSWLCTSSFFPRLEFGKFFCKGPDNMYFRLCRSYSLCRNHSSLPS